MFYSRITIVMVLLLILIIIRNKLNSELDFSLANSICGYGIKSGFGAGNEIRYVSDYWGSQHCFDILIAILLREKNF